MYISVLLSLNFLLGGYSHTALAATQEAYKKGIFFFSVGIVEGKKFRLDIDPANITIDKTGTKLDFQITISGKFAKTDEFEYEYAIGGPNFYSASHEQRDGFTFPHTRINEAILTLNFEKGADDFIDEPTFSLFSADKKRMRQDTEKVFDKRIGALYTSFSKKEIDVALPGGRLVATWKSK